MKFNNINSFLFALESRIEDLEEGDAITSATILSKRFSPEEYEKFDSVVDEAKALTDSDNDFVTYVTNRLYDLGYSDDEVTGILDMEGI